jgi:hypothetical protein
LSAGVRVCTNHILYGLKHSRLHNTFHTVILACPIPCFLRPLTCEDFVETSHALFQC